MPNAPLLDSPIVSLNLPVAAETLQIEERAGLCKLILRGDTKDDAFRNAVEGVLETPLPSSGFAAANKLATILWQGPDSWLVVCPNERIDTITGALRSSLQSLFSAVTDVSSASTVLRIAGPKARDLLYKGCFIDLDEPAFKAGHCAATRIAAFAVTIHRLQDAQAYDLYVARGMALAFGRWLLDAGREFGLD